MLLVMVTAANVTDRDAAKELLFRVALMHPEIAIVWADSAYAGKLVTWAKTYLDITIKTVRRPPDAKGFVVLPRRWVVERSWSWIMRAPSLPGLRGLPEMSESLITWAAITLMSRRLTRRKAQPAARRDVTPVLPGTSRLITQLTRARRLSRTAATSAGRRGSATGPRARSGLG